MPSSASIDVPLTEPAARGPAPRLLRRRLVTLAIVVATGAGLWFGLGTGGGPSVVRAPAFSVPRLGGGPAVGLPLPPAEADRPVVLTFFASWCPPCHKDLPVVAGVARRAGTAGSPVVFVGIDGDDAPASGLAFARRSGVGFVVGADGASAVAPRFGLVGYPDTVFVDRAGDVVGTVQGPVSRSTLQAWVRRLASSAA